MVESGAASASRGGPSSRLYPAGSEPDLASIASSDSGGRRGVPPATPRPAGYRIGQQPMTQPVNRTKPRTKSPPPVKPVSCRIFCLYYCTHLYSVDLRMPDRQQEITASGVFESVFCSFCDSIIFLAVKVEFRS